MATRPIVHRVRTVITGVSGGPWYTNFYFGHTAAGQPAADWGKTRTLAWWDALRVNMVAGAQITVLGEVPAYDAVTGEVIRVYGGQDTTRATQLAGDPLPPANQMFVKFSTAEVRRRRLIRGGAFIPRMPEAGSVDGRPDAGLRTAAQNALNALISPPAPDGTGNLCVWARPRDVQVVGATIRLPGVAALVENASIKTEFAVLRSRRD